MTNDEIFERLEKWGDRENSYSIRDFAKEIGVPFLTIKELAKQSKERDHIFKIAKARCARNGMRARIENKITDGEAARCAYENDFSIQDRLREEGVIVPEDPDEFDEWVEMQIARDNAMYNSLAKIKHAKLLNE